MKISMAVPAVLALLLALPLCAATIRVPGDQPTIQTGIGAAVDGDTVLVADGWYAGPGNANIDFLGKAITVRSENGAANCIIDCMGDGRGFIFQSGEGEDSILQGFTIRNGRVQYQGGGIYCLNSSPTIRDNTLRENFAAAVPSSDMGHGGGIYLENSTSQITGNTFDANETESAWSWISYGNGGGIFATGCSLEITGNTFTGNLANDWGGLVCESGSGTVISGNLFADNIGGGMGCWDSGSLITDNQVIGNLYCTHGGMRIYHSTGGRGTLVSGNTISDNSGAYAGGLEVYGPVTVTDNLVSGNYAGIGETWSGGGIAVRGGAPLITGNVITGNESDAFGAGINSSFAGPIITGNVITDNVAGYAGGGIHVEKGSAQIRGNLIGGNHAGSGGGGIACFRQSNSQIISNLIINNSCGHDGGGIAVRYDSSPAISNCTIAGNTAATQGGAIACYNSCNPAVENSILWGNGATYGDEIIVTGVGTDPSSLAIGWCDLEGGQSAVWVATGSSLTWGEGMIDADPLFASGPSGDHYLSQLAAGQAVNSPCVDAGDPDAVPVDGTTRTDEVPDEGVVDMGHHYLFQLPGARPLVVAGLGPGRDNPPRVRGFLPEQDASRMFAFQAYGPPHYGVNLGVGDLDGDRGDELLTGPGPGEQFGPHVRGFGADGTPLPGLSFLAYGTNRFGVNVAGGNLDADGFDEIITGPGPGEVFGPHVRGWNYDNGGTVSAMAGVNFFAFGTPKWGVAVAAGDLDGDGFDEIVTGAGPGPVYGAHVRGWNVDGGPAAAIPEISYFAYDTPRYGVRVSCGDIDGDGLAEIVTAPGPSPAFGAHIRGWNFDGTTVTGMTAVDFFAWPPEASRNGASVYAGSDLDGDGRTELVVGAGPDPAVGARVKVYALEGSRLLLRFSLQAFPESWTHGASVAAGRF